MDTNKQILDKSRFSLPHLNRLQYVSPRIECRKENGEWELTGSGVLFSAEDKFYVITAAHCLREDPDRTDSPQLNIENLRIVLSIPTQYTYNINCIHTYEAEDDVDFALLEVDFRVEDRNDFDYANHIKFVGSDIDTHDFNKIAVFGHNQHHLDGYHLICNLTAKNTYKLSKGFTAACKDLKILKGFSGSGIFTEISPILYCMGFVKEVLTGNNDLDDIGVRYVPELPFKNVWSKSLTNDSLYKSQSFGNNTAQQNYNESWSELQTLMLIHPVDEKKYSSLLDKIDRARCLYPRQKGVSRQISVERSLFNNHWNFPDGKDEKKDENWTENDKRAFAYVMRDRGTWPALYGRLHPSLNDLCKKGYMQPILRRAATITGNFEFDTIEPDSSKHEERYELIMRSAFALDFKRMKELLFSWNPDSAWLPKKVVLKSLWSISNTNDQSPECSDITEDLNQLKNYINSGAYNPEDKFIACIIYNFCSNTIPFEYDKKDFIAAGLDSPFVVISDMGNKIDKKNCKPQPYGIHTTYILGNQDTDSFPESLRILQYLLNSGLLPAINIRATVNVDVWLKVFRHLFFNFPNALVFYSLTYSDSKLLSVCAQEIAFVEADDFSAKRNKILSEIINAIVSDETPSHLYDRLYVMAIELFSAVDEDVWTDLFIDSIERILSDIEIETFSAISNLSKYLEAGISNINKNETKKKIIILFSKYFDRNPFIFSYIISLSLDFNDDLITDPDIHSIIENIITSYPFSKTYRLIEKLNFNNCLINFKADIEPKLNADDFSFAKNNSDALALLSNLVSETEQISKLRSVILNSWDRNYWNCGIEGNTFSSKGFLHLDIFDDRISYDESELEAVIGNMKSNISVIKNTPTDHFFSSHIRYLTTDLLICMKRFINKPNVRPNIDFENLSSEIDELILKLSNNDSIIGLICSDEYHDVKNGILLLRQLIDKDSISKYQKEISMLISVATFKVKESIELAIYFISYLMETFPDEMNNLFRIELSMMIRKYSNFDYQELRIHALNIRKSIQTIANHLQNSESK